MRRTILILMLVLPALAVQAQEFYYHSVMPDGRIVIGDKPAPGAKDVKKIPLAKGNVSAPLSTPGQPGTAGAAPQQQAPGAADIDIRNAQLELQDAKAALEAGREPQPGERIGTAGGASRLTDAYFQRIKALENAVGSAQKRLDEAYSRRNFAR